MAFPKSLTSLSLMCKMGYYCPGAPHLRPTALCPKQLTFQWTSVERVVPHSPLSQSLPAEISKTVALQKGRGHFRPGVRSPSPAPPHSPSQVGSPSSLLGPRVQSQRAAGGCGRGRGKHSWRQGARDRGQGTGDGGVPGPGRDGLIMARWPNATESRGKERR